MTKIGMKQINIELGNRTLSISYDSHLVLTGETCSACLLPSDEMFVDIHEVLDADKMIDVELTTEERELIKKSISEEFETFMDELHAEEGASLCPKCKRPDGRDIDRDLESAERATSYTPEHTIDESDPYQ